VTSFPERSLEVLHFNEPLLEFNFKQTTPHPKDGLFLKGVCYIGLVYKTLPGDVSDHACCAACWRQETLTLELDQKRRDIGRIGPP
jgi:hypothetical protein